MPHIAYLKTDSFSENAPFLAQGGSLSSALLERERCLQDVCRSQSWNFTSLLSSSRPLPSHDCLVASITCPGIETLIGESVPLIVDLYGLSPADLAYSAPRHELFLNILSKADLLLVATNDDRLYYYGWLVQAGRVPENDLMIAVLSNDGVQEERQAFGQLMKRFLTNPQRSCLGKPILGAIYSKPSFLNAPQPECRVSLPTNGTALEQPFIVPAENIAGLEIPFYRHKDSDSLGQVELVVLRGRRSLARRVIKGEDIPIQGVVFLPFSVLFVPKGGETLMLRLKLYPGKREAIDSDPGVSVSGLLTPSFPLLERTGAKVYGKTPKDERVVVGGISMSFLPGEFSRLYQAKMLLQRAFHMLEEGEWKRLFRAVIRRVPRLLPR